MSPSNSNERQSHIRDENHNHHYFSQAAETMFSESIALLVVDVQPESWSGCPQVRSDFEDFPTNLQKAITLCRRQNAKIIWVRSDYSHDSSPWLVRLYGKDPKRISSSPPSSPKDSRKWEDFAIPQEGDIVVTKQKSWSGTHRTGLLSYLREQHDSSIDTVLVCGIFTSSSVQHTAFGVFEAGYRTLLVEDACADRGRARHEAALALYGNYMYEVLATQDLEAESAGVPSDLCHAASSGCATGSFNTMSTVPPVTSGSAPE